MLQDQIEDLVFREAVALLDAGDAEGLRVYLNAHPGLIKRRVSFAGRNYFSHPALLEFAAENPIRRGALPPNIAQTVRVILDAGGKHDRASVDETLGLVCSGCVPRQCRVQVPLIHLLCDYGANPDFAMLPALAHGEFEAAEALIERGAKITLAVAAATGRGRQAGELLAGATADQRHLALALAAQHGHAESVRLLLDAGEDPNRFNPPGTHAHSTPLHQAAVYGHQAVIQLLVERGADLNVKDLRFGGTPLGWALHGKQAAAERILRSAAH
jgi:peptide-methionine (S)-S-oxide reductase